MPECIVHYVERQGFRHSVELHAQSLYEAVVRAVVAFRTHGCEPSGDSKLEVEVRTSVRHELTWGQVQDWLGMGSKSPKEAITKEQLRSLL